MKIRFKQLKKIINTHINENWSELINDLALDEENDSVWLEKKSKSKIKSWMKAMGLAEKPVDKDRYIEENR